MLFAKLSANQNQISLNIIFMLGKCVRKRHPRTPHALAKFSAGFAEKLFAMFAQAYPSRPINNLWLLHLPVCMHQMNQHAAILPENQPVLLDGKYWNLPYYTPLFTWTYFSEFRLHINSNFTGYIEQNYDFYKSDHTTQTFTRIIYTPQYEYM